MSTYVMLTKLSPEAVKEPRAFEELGKEVTEEIKVNCPNVKWIGSYATLGPYDYVDIFEAPDSQEAAKVALVIRTFGHAVTETWDAIPWDRFLNLVGQVHK